MSRPSRVDAHLDTVALTVARCRDRPGGRAPRPGGAHLAVLAIDVVAVQVASRLDAAALTSQNLAALAVGCRCRGPRVCGCSFFRRRGFRETRAHKKANTRKTRAAGLAGRPPRRGGAGLAVLVVDAVARCRGRPGGRWTRAATRRRSPRGACRRGRRAGLAPGRPPLHGGAPLSPRGACRRCRGRRGGPASTRRRCPRGARRRCRGRRAERRPRRGAVPSRGLPSMSGPSSSTHALTWRRCLCGAHGSGAGAARGVSAPFLGRDPPVSHGQGPGHAQHPTLLHRLHLLRNLRDLPNMRFRRRAVDRPYSRSQTAIRIIETW